MNSPNKIFEEIELEGGTYRLAIDMKFYKMFHKLTGKDLLAGEKPAPGVVDATTLIYCAIRSGGGEITEDELDGLIHPLNLEYVLETFRALQEANNPKARRNGSDPLAVAPEPETQPTG